MKGTLFSADFVKDSNGDLRLLELNTDTGFIDQELDNFNFNDLNQLLIDNNITSVDLIYKPYLHIDFINKLSASITANVPNVTSINLHEENIHSIYPASIPDSPEKFILRISYDESALFDSEYCKNRLNVYNLFVDNGITNNTVGYYYSSSNGTYNTLTKEINQSNVPDATIKNIVETSNPIQFIKIGNPTPGETNEQRWDSFISENLTTDTLIEQYHFSPSGLDQDDHITSVRYYGIVYGSNLSVINLHSYKISSIFELPTTIDGVDETKYTNKLPKHHYYEFVTNFFKNDSPGILSSHEVLMNDDVWKEISAVNVGESVKSYYIEGLPKNENDLDALSWEVQGSSFPIGSYITTSEVVYKDIASLKYGAMMEMIVDNDSLFSGIRKRFLVYDSINDVTKFKFISEINNVTDYLFDIDGDLIQVDEINFYVTSDTNLSFIELDVEDADTYMINGSTAFNTLVSHNSPCFVEGTKVLTGDGTEKNIEDVNIGDSILSFDFKNNTNQITTVLNIFSKKVNKIVEYEFKNGGILKATTDHPIYVIDKGWSSYSNKLSNVMYKIEGGVHEIKIGDIVKFYDSETELVSINIIEKETKVFNLSDIKTYHNYYANNVLVHNRVCFVSGTKITLADGSTKNIEDIKIGDNVLSFNEETKLQESQAVTKIITPIHDDLVTYTFEDGSKITCTYDHPFYVNEFKLASYKPDWTSERYKLNVSEIKIGDVVHLINKDTLKIINIVELEKKPTQTYIFEVNKNHNFYANNILTHNKTCFIKGTKILVSGGLEKNIEDIEIGDLVLSFNEKIKQHEYKRVVNTYQPIHNDLVRYTFSNNISITSTFDHPYYVNGLELASYKPDWTNHRYNLPSNVKQIMIGDSVLLSSGERLSIKSIEELDKIDTQTYIISVEDNRNFYANDILVHNK
jgi:hypothetical protein